MPAIEVPDWYRTVALVGVDGTGEPVVVLLDSTGAIVSVMKATYSGVLKNAACDDQGRMIMIPTDPADVWGNAISMGNAELAACLTMAKRFDRRGNVMWLTDFSDGLQGSSIGVDHADSVGVLSTNRAFSGAYSLKMDPRGAADAYVNWVRILHFLIPGGVGFETAISLDTDPLRVIWSMTYRDGTNAWLAQVNYDPSTGNWIIYKAPGAWQTVLTGIILQQGQNTWHQVKMVMDVTAEKYTRLLVDKSEVDLSAYSLYKTADVALGQLRLLVQITASAAVSEAVYLGGVTITQNEPA